MCSIPLATTLAFAALAAAGPGDAFERRVNAAIDRARDRLERMQADDGGFTNMTAYNRIGATALVAWALLEAGTPPTDPVLVRAVAHVRSMADSSDCVYSIACAIFLLDRLGEPPDRPLIRRLTGRLAAGLTKEGGWGYRCPPPVAFLTPTDPVPDRITTPPVFEEDDNSNTQFATLALWVGRRAGMDPGDQFRAIEKRFRSTAFRSGGYASWKYRPAEPTPIDTMLCAGLIGLAVAPAADSHRPPGDRPGGPDGRIVTRNPLDDPLVKEGLRTLKNCFVRLQRTPVANLDPKIPYFLWSAERVATAFGLETLDGVDWYRIGAETFLATQQADGLWRAAHDPAVDTAFAVLFLKKANAASDMATTIRREPRAQQAVPGSSLPTKPDDRSQKSVPGAVAPAPPAAPAEADQDAAVAEFVKQPAGEQMKRLQLARDGKGGQHTEFLRLAIPKLRGEPQRLARDYLVERLARMTPATLRDKLQDVDAEVRRAAALACAVRAEKELIPDLVAAVGDADPTVARACGVALRLLTNQDLGPPVNPGADAINVAAAAWKRWLAAQPK